MTAGFILVVIVVVLFLLSSYFKNSMTSES